MTIASIASTVSPVSIVPLTRLNNVRRIGTGFAFILFPLLFVFEFEVHLGLLNPHRLSEEELILRAYRNGRVVFSQQFLKVKSMR